MHVVRDYRRGHAGRDHRVEQLLWLGAVCRGIHAQQQSDDDRRRPHRVLWSYPILHHVQGMTILSLSCQFTHDSCCEVRSSTVAIYTAIRNPARNSLKIAPVLDRKL